MEPAVFRGDLLFLTNYEDDPLEAGEVVVFKVEGREIPIVHRVIKLHEQADGQMKSMSCSLRVSGCTRKIGSLFNSM